MADIAIVNGVYKPTYNWGGTILQDPKKKLQPQSHPSPWGGFIARWPTDPMEVNSRRILQVNKDSSDLAMEIGISSG